MASLRRAVAGVLVEHITQVCDVWSFLEPFTLSYSLYSYYAFEVSKNDIDEVVLRYKTTMHSDTWLPCGRFADDRSFAPRMLRKGTHCGVERLRFVVPSVLPVQSLRSMVAFYEHRLTRPRSVHRLPDGPEGACVT